MLYLRQRLLDEMIQHAKSERPNEACGLIAGVDGRAIKLYKGTNVDENKRVRYSMDPKEILNASREIDANGWELLAIYHSHPHSQAYPSSTDVSLAFYPEANYIIISLMEPNNPAVRAFRIVDGKITEVRIEIVADDEQQSRER